MHINAKRRSAEEIKELLEAVKIELLTLNNWFALNNASLNKR